MSGRGSLTPIGYIFHVHVQRIFPTINTKIGKLCVMPEQHYTFWHIFVILYASPDKELTIEITRTGSRLSDSNNSRSTYSTILTTTSILEGNCDFSSDNNVWTRFYAFFVIFEFLLFLL